MEVQVDAKANNIYSDLELMEEGGDERGEEEGREKEEGEKIGDNGEN